MKLTDDVLKALKSGIDACGSKAAFAAKAGINVASIGKYLSCQTMTIADDTWEKIYPVIKPYLPEQKRKEVSSRLDACVSAEGISSDQKILLDAFAELPAKLQSEKLIEIVNLAREEIQKKRGH